MNLLTGSLFLLAAWLSEEANGATVVKRAARCYPSQACFPSASILATFNASIGGNLFAERPYAAACYAGDPKYNLANCATILARGIDDQWRSDVFGTSVVFVAYMCLLRLI